MMDDQLAYLYDLIPDFIKGKLRAEEAEQVKQQMTINQKFAREVEDQRELMMAIELYGQGGIMEEAEKIFDKKEKTSLKTFSLRSPKIWLPMAAVIAGLLFLIVFLNFHSRKSDAKIIAMEVFPDKVSQDYRGSGSGMIDNPAMADTFLLGIKNYEEENFELAENYFSAFRDKLTLDLNAPFYQALSLIHLGENAQAIAILEPLAADADFSFQEEAQLRLAALYWQTGELQKAIQYLNELKQSSDPKKKKKADNY
ncbi:MAG: tetratricopeptide repeat protein, partial [Bacteroidetes bacterium]|nr:tetratricopeptide repeat protein [Bacteroidota bacterium]